MRENSGQLVCINEKTFEELKKANEEKKELETRVMNYKKEISEMNGVIARQRKEIKDMRFKGQKQQRKFHRLKGVKHREWKC